ncbi:hypothetical protein [Parapedobacter sp.]
MTKEWVVPRFSSQVLIGFLWVGFISASFVSYQEKYFKRMAGGLTSFNAEFTMPDNFSELDAGRRFPCGDYNITNAMLYTICNRDSSIRIAFSFVSEPSERILNRMRRQNPNFEVKMAHLNTIKAQADTINHEVLFFNNQHLKKFNADIGAMYTRNCTLPYEDKYPYHKIVFVYKRGRGHIEITYFYTDSAKDYVMDVIDQTAGIICFKDQTL